MRNRLTILLFLFIGFVSSALAASNNHYLIYVKSGCSNCSYAKQSISAADSSYTFLSVDSAGVGSAMVKKLRNLGYNGRIIMPVVIANDTVLMHPAHKKDNKYTNSDLATIIESLKSKTIYFDEAIEEEKSEDCDFKQEDYFYYSVCCNYKDEESAIKMVDQLKQQGYSRADFIFYKKWFRVYTDISNKYHDGDNAVKEMRSEFKAAYLLKEKIE